jgi:hypothetical protein
VASEAFAGVTASDTNTGAVTVRLAEPPIACEVAWIVVLPTATAVAKPALVIVATAVFVDVQVTELVRFRVPPSLKSPMAVNCCFTPFAIEILAGVTVMETSTAVTVRVVEPLIEPEAAWTVVMPVAVPVARPPVLIVATAVFVELQVTVLVRFCLLLSLYVPVAVNCCVMPATIEGFAGVTASDTNVAGKV